MYGHMQKNQRWNEKYKFAIRASWFPAQIHLPLHISINIQFIHIFAPLDFHEEVTHLARRLKTKRIAHIAAHLPLVPPGSTNTVQLETVLVPKHLWLVFARTSHADTVSLIPITCFVSVDWFCICVLFVLATDTFVLHLCEICFVFRIYFKDMWHDRTINHNPTLALYWARILSCICPVFAGASHCIITGRGDTVTDTQRQLCGRPV